MNRVRSRFTLVELLVVIAMMVLPFLEETPAFEKYNKNLSWFAEANNESTTTNIKTFLCPSATGAPRITPTQVLMNDRGITYGTPQFGASDYSAINNIRRAAWSTS